MRVCRFILAGALATTAAAAMGQPPAASETNGVDSVDLDSVLFAPTPLGGHNYLNWSDLPFTISATQSIGYNDNVLGLAQGQPTPANTPLRGDLFSTTAFGASTKITLGQQQFFADASYGITRFRVDTADDTHQYSLDAGVNWAVTSRCSGRFVAAQNQYQTPIDEQVGSGINTVLATSVSETATCLSSGYTSLILDSGWSSNVSSLAIDALNNYDSVYVRGGFQYSLTGLDTMRALITATQREFTDRAASLSIAGLASGTDEVDYQLFYNRTISPKLTFNGMIGIAQVTPNFATPSVVSTAQGAASTTETVPIYLASLLWQPTPKLSFGVSSSRSVGAPTSTLSNAEITTTQSATTSYLFSPKISLQLGVAYSKISTGAESTLALPSVGIGSQTTESAFWRASYFLTPFVTTTASYRFSETADDGINTKDNTIMLSLVYRPQ